MGSLVRIVSLPLIVFGAALLLLGVRMRDPSMALKGAVVIAVGVVLRRIARSARKKPRREAWEDDEW